MTQPIIPYLALDNDCHSVIIPRARSASPTILISRASSRRPVTPTIGLRSARVDKAAGPTPLPRRGASPYSSTRLVYRPWLLWANLARVYKRSVAWSDRDITPPHARHTIPCLQSIAHIYNLYPARLATHHSPTHPRCQPINLKQGLPAQPNRRHWPTQRIFDHYTAVLGSQGIYTHPTQHVVAVSSTHKTHS